MDLKLELWDIRFNAWLKWHVLWHNVTWAPGVGHISSNVTGDWQGAIKGISDMIEIGHRSVLFVHSQNRRESEKQ